MKRLFSLPAVMFLVAAPALGQEQKSKPVKADPGATKLLAEARAAQAVWKDFPGFTADLVVNHNGKLLKGNVKVSPKGKVTLDLPKSPITQFVHQEISSLVDDRLFSGEAQDTPCAYADKNADHPLGRKIVVLNDELHSSYRVRDRQITEVNRMTKKQKDSRFALNRPTKQDKSRFTILGNSVNAEKKFLPAFYIVNSGSLGSQEASRFPTFIFFTSRTHHNTWQRIGSFDLPAQITIVTSVVASRSYLQPGPLGSLPAETISWDASGYGRDLDTVRMSFSNYELEKK